MIYSAEITFTSPAHEPEWNAWYDTHLPELLQVPGFETAQRFRGLNPSRPLYRALYTVISPAVFESQAYRDMGGGGVASAKWKPYMRRYRYVFDGVDRLPEIREGACLLMSDLPPEKMNLPDVLFCPLEVVLKNTPTPEHDPESVKFPDPLHVARNADPNRVREYQYLAATTMNVVKRLDLQKVGGLGIYVPITGRSVSNR